jgi:hypothetical protein
MRFAYCALQSEPHRKSGGYWIARSSRAMTAVVGEAYPFGPAGVG